MVWRRKSAAWRCYTPRRNCAMENRRRRRRFWSHSRRAKAMWLFWTRLPTRCGRPASSTAREQSWNVCCAKRMKASCGCLILPTPTRILDSKSVEILQTLKRRMFADKKSGEFVVQVEALGAKHPESLPILEFWAAVYNELNRESQYFEVLIKLFDANFNSGSFPKASEVLERLVDIDSYDYRNQQRLEQLRGHVDEAFLRRIAGRMAKTAIVDVTSSTPPKIVAKQEVAEAQPVTEEGRKLQALEDLIVQTEIFLQYSLQSKAVERLQKIAAMFPGEETRSERLHNLYQL